MASIILGKLTLIFLFRIEREKDTIIKLNPVRSRKERASDIPFVKEKFSTNTSETTG